MDNNIILNRLKEYGVSIDEITERFMGDMELYFMCLNEFLSDNNFKTLEKALSDGDNQTAFEAAHSLKGMSGNMGLAPMYKAVCELSDALKIKDYSNLDAQYARVSAEYDKISKLVFMPE